MPNFDTFRKRLALGIGGLVLLIGFLVWAIWFAPKAQIVITARTIESSANPKVALATSANTDAKAGTMKAVQQEVKKEAALDFEATGDKEVGEKAKGQVVFHNCQVEDTVVIAAGTGISAGGNTYITQAAASVPAGKPGFGGTCTPGKSSPIEVVAQEIGNDYDTDSGTQFNVAGRPNSTTTPYFRAVASTDIDGGSKRKIKVVTAGDVEKAIDQLVSQSNNDMKNQLISKFGEDAIVIDTTFKAHKDKVTSAPAVDAEAPDGKAKLGGSIVFTMIGVNKSEVNRFLDAYFAGQIKDEDNQRVYENGADKTTFLDVVALDNGFTATMTATAKFGPKIDDNWVRDQARGKKFGEVQSAIEGVSGVESVDVKFSPFWVRTVPNDDDRITVSSKVDGSEE